MHRCLKHVCALTRADGTKPEIHDVGGLLESDPFLRHAHDHVGMLAQVETDQDQAAKSTATTMLPC